MIRLLLSISVIACVVGCEEEVVEDPVPKLTENWQQFERLTSEEGMKTVSMSLEIGYRGGAIQHVNSKKFSSVVDELEKSAPPSEVTTPQQEELVAKLRALIEGAGGTAIGFDNALEAARNTIEELEKAYYEIKLAEYLARPKEPEPPSAYRYWKNLFFGSKDEQVRPAPPSADSDADA